MSWLKRVYDQLLSHPETRKHIDGRLDMLKGTHIQWMSQLFTGPHDEAFFARQEVIGVVHVRVKIPLLFVSSSMSFYAMKSCTCCASRPSAGTNLESRWLLVAGAIISA